MSGRGRKAALALLVAISVAPQAGCGEDEPAAPEPPASATAQNQLPAGKYLYLGGEHHLTVVDVDAGASWQAGRPWLGSLQTFPARILRRGRRLVYYGKGGEVDSIDLNLLQRPRRLMRRGPFNDAGFFIPSARADRVWVTVPNRKGGAPRLIREVTAGGRVTVPDVALPYRNAKSGGGFPVVAFRGQLGLSTGSLLGLRLWNPQSRRPGSKIRHGGHGPTFGNLLARGSYAGPHIHLTNVAIGRDRSIRLPSGYAGFDTPAATFSPNGHLLAVPVSHKQGFLGARRLALIHVATGSVSIVPGSKVDRGAGFVTWSSDGRRVFMSGASYGPQSEGQIVAYRLSEPAARRVQGKIPEFFGMAAN
jgi:hypothetical protein